VCEDGIKEYSKASREFDVVAGVSQPRGAECGRFSSWEEGGRLNSDCWRGGVWAVGFPVEASPIAFSTSSTCSIIWEQATLSLPCQFASPVGPGQMKPTDSGIPCLL
jgi:hypothetical protein